ncbi:MAG: DUF1464 family protein [Gemmataceae bacterium]
MPRVAGTDPGTSSLDIVILQDGAVAEQCRFTPEQLQADVQQVVRWLANRGPFDCIAGPSGYGLPLVPAQDVTERDLALMRLVRSDERGQRQGVLGFSALTRALRDSGLPVMFLPGVIHLPTVPRYRKFNRIDLGTADKLCVAALALERYTSRPRYELIDGDLCVVELGLAFTACVALRGGCIVDGVGGTGGPVGWRSGGAWDGELAYLLSPLSKNDLFHGGVSSMAVHAESRMWLRESLLKTVAGLKAVVDFQDIVLSGRLLEIEPQLTQEIVIDLQHFAPVAPLASLSGAWIKHAAQGAAIIADGLAGGRHAPLVEHLQLRGAAGTVLDWIQHPRAPDALFD